MRANGILRSEEWPRAMTITVDPKPTFLLELLWVREAHDLRPEGEGLPPLLTDTPARVTDSSISDAVRSQWRAAWPELWHAAAAHAGVNRRSTLFAEFAKLKRTADGSPERADLVGRILGPHWRDAFGDAAFRDGGYGAWAEAGPYARLAALCAAPEEDDPERRDLDALLPAWRAGLTTFVTIPCRGEFVQRIGPNALLVTDATRDDSASYRRALAAFG
jgi:hypothetical protein